MKSKSIAFLFFTLLSIEIIGEFIFLNKNSPFLLFAIKPLLMPTLIVWAFLFTKENKLQISSALICALIFSMFGDIILMLTIYKPNIFVIGLVSFLITHIIYISIFLKRKSNETKNILIKKPYLLTIPILYVTALVWFFFQQDHPEFISLKIPIFIYSAIILSMLIVVISLHKQISNRSYKLLVAGVTLFVLSDTVIALSKFSYVFTGNQFVARIIIMSLYGLAQFMIVKGYILSLKEQSTLVQSTT